MIGWQNPAALWALPLAAVPVIIHLLRTHHARRVAFPSIRFVPSSRTAAVRMRLPSDVLLMLLRVGIVALAIGAAAGPILLTDARIQAWDARTARAVVVDVSDSMRAPDGSGQAPERVAAEAAQAELDSAASSRRFEVRRRNEMDEALTRASRWLQASPPARREIVVISDFHHGVWQPADAASVPDGVGLRLIPVGRPRRRGGLRRCATLWRRRCRGPQPGYRSHERCDRRCCRTTSRERNRRAASRWRPRAQRRASNVSCKPLRRPAHRRGQPTNRSQYGSPTRDRLRLD